MKRLRVVFLAAHVKHYRRAFFDALYTALQEDGIDLRVLYGAPNGEHAARKDNIGLPPAYGRAVPSYWILDRLVYQSAWQEIAAADLVITPNENKLLLNPILLALRAGGVKRVAFWGKGNISPSRVSSPGEWFRYHTAGAVDWWFPYTQSSAEHLRQHGVRCGITPIDNAIDTSELHEQIASITPECLRNARYSVGTGTGPIGIFCGNLSKNKQLEFLFSAGKLIHEAIPSFTLLVIGNGPMREYVELTATRERFIRYLGPRMGREKALLLKMADLFLLPGAVGLAILDSFAAGLPLLTTELSSHGPEISYLSHGDNGFVTPHDPQAYSNQAVRILQDPQLLMRLRAGAAESGMKYNIARMVEHFRQGIHDCLGTSAGETVAPFGSTDGIVDTSLKQLPGGRS